MASQSTTGGVSSTTITSDSDSDSTTGTLADDHISPTNSSIDAAMIGGIVGGVAALLLIAGVVVALIVCRKRRSSVNHESSTEMPTALPPDGSGSGNDIYQDLTLTAPTLASEYGAPPRVGTWSSDADAN